MHKVHIYEHRLPHWRADGATYFVTWRVHREQPDLSPEERRLVVSALDHFDGSRYALHAFAVMNDHVHVLTTPVGGEVLERIVWSWKSFTANQMQKHGVRRGPVWQDEYMDRIVRSEGEFLEIGRYILNNPWKRWPGLTEYEWVGNEGDQLT